MRNRAHHTDINFSPYEATFEANLNVGIKSCPISKEALININSEENLKKLLTTEAQVKFFPDVLDVQPNEKTDKDLYLTESQVPEISKNIQGEESVTTSYPNKIATNETALSESNVDSRKENFMLVS